MNFDQDFQLSFIKNYCYLHFLNKNFCTLTQNKRQGNAGKDY